MSSEAFVASVESDLRLLANEARRSESLAGQLTGWLSGPEHPIIKELAERAVLKLQSLAGAEDAVQQLQHSKVGSIISQSPLTFSWGPLLCVAALQALEFWLCRTSSSLFCSLWSPRAPS